MGEVIREEFRWRDEKKPIGQGYWQFYYPGHGTWTRAAGGVAPKRSSDMTLEHGIGTGSVSRGSS